MSVVKKQKSNELQKLQAQLDAMKHMMEQLRPKKANALNKQLLVQHVRHCGRPEGMLRVVAGAQKGCSELLQAPQRHCSTALPVSRS